MLMRNLPFYNKKVHEGSYQWSDWRTPIPRFRGATYGLIGFGRIARNAARKLSAFGFNLLAYDPYVSESLMRSHNVKKVSLEALVSSSDVINVFAPYTPETHHIIGKETLNMMKKNAVVVCVSRGKCVDNSALYEALRDRKITGAALDDPEEEPMKIKDWDPANNPLFSLDNCFFTPHTSYVSQESLNECRRVASENVRAVLLGEKPMDVVKPRKA